MRGRTGLWWGLGTFWLLDGLLLAQPAMFTAQFVQEVLEPASQGQPAWLAATMGIGAALWQLNPVVANAAAMLIELGIGVLLLTGRERPSGRFGLWLSIAWGLGVWLFGEGLGGLLTGSATPLNGAPGPVLFYVLGAALLLLPARWWSGERLGRWGLRGLGVFWLAMAAAQAWPAAGYWSGDALANVFGAAAASPQPAVLAAPIRRVAAAAGAAPALCNAAFVAVLAVLGCCFLCGRVRWWAQGLTMGWLLFTWWIGQDFGGLFSGTLTDPDTALPLALLVLVLAAAAPSQPASRPGAPGRSCLLVPFGVRRLPARGPLS